MKVVHRIVLALFLLSAGFLIYMQKMTGSVLQNLLQG